MLSLRRVSWSKPRDRSLGSLFRRSRSGILRISVRLDRALACAISIQRRVRFSSVAQLPIDYKGGQLEFSSRLPELKSNTWSAESNGLRGAAILFAQRMEL